MGFKESYIKFMQKLFPAPKDWDKHLTEEQINDMEKQGCDVTEIRQRFEARKAAEAAERQRLIEMLDFSKLNQYMAIPRAMDSAFIEDVASLDKMSSKRKQRLAEAPIVYGAVVQAFHALWKPDTCNARMGVVFVFAMDQEHMHDEEFLRKMAKKISTLKESKELPKDCEKFIKTLRDDQSMFCFKVGDSITEGADVWCATFTWEKQSPETLPGGCLPPTRVMPLLLNEYPKVNQFAEFVIIPPKYYCK